MGREGGGGGGSLTGHLLFWSQISQPYMSRTDTHLAYDITSLCYYTNMNDHIDNLSDSVDELYISSTSEWTEEADFGLSDSNRIITN